MSEQKKGAGQGVKAGIGLSGIGLGIGGIVAFAMSGSELGLAVSINNLVQGLMALWECIQERRSKRTGYVDVRLRGRPETFGFVSRNGPVSLLVAGLLATAALVPSNACGTAFADGAATAGSCVARCALSCATSWVGDLVNLPTPDEQYGHTEGTLPRPGAVLQLLVRDDAGDPVAIMGRLVASPQLVDGGLRVGLMRTADGTLLSVLLAPEPRIWHASAELFDAPIAPDGWVPSDMPVGLEDMVDRLGEPPATW